MDQTDKFWDKIAQRYAKKPVVDEESYQKKLLKSREYFRPDMEVLEIGCGTGSTAIVHAPYVKHIQAIDISSKMIDIARGKAEEGNIKNVTFKCSAIDELSLPDESLDAVLALSILHLVENRAGVIAGVHRMLKPGGIFITSTACLEGAMKIIRLIEPLGRFFGLMPMVKCFTAKELAKSISSAGFKIDYQWQPGKYKALFIVAIKN